MKIADGIAPLIVKVSELLDLDKSFVIGLVVDPEKRYIFAPTKLGRLGAVKCTIQDQETHGVIIRYDEVYDCTLIQYSPTTVTLPRDTPPLSGVHLQEGTNVQVYSMNSSNKVTILAGKLGFIKGCETGITAVTYSAVEAGAVPGSPVLDMTGNIISVVTGAISPGTDSIVSLAIALLLCRTKENGGQGGGGTWINCTATGGGTQHNGPIISR